MERNKEKRLGKAEQIRRLPEYVEELRPIWDCLPKVRGFFVLGCVCCFQMESLHIYCLRQCFLFQTVKMQGDKKGEKKWGKYWQ